MNGVTFGVGAVLVYTGLISAADGITKLIAVGYAPAQLYAVSGLLIAALCAGAVRLQRRGQGLRTQCVAAMAVRSVATVIACICFFYAFRYLTLAEVFVFVALMPVMAALLSNLILRESVSPMVWGAIIIGGMGLLVMRPGVHVAGAAGSFFAFGGVAFGTLSLVMARYISQHEDSVLAQVFYPNLALGLVMAAVLPFVWEPMTLRDFAWVITYAVVLFGARWLLVYALRILPAYTVMPLLHLQFIWVTLIGLFVFAEYPPVTTYWGMAVIAVSGVFLVWDQLRNHARKEIASKAHT